MHGSTYNAEECKYIIEITNIAQLFNSRFKGNHTKTELQQKFHRVPHKQNSAAHFVLELTVKHSGVFKGYTWDKESNTNEDKYNFTNDFYF